MRVAILPGQMNGCAYYRLFLPLITLRDRGEIELRCSIAYQDQNGSMQVQPVGNLPFELIAKACSYGTFALHDQDVEMSDAIILQKAGGRHLSPELDQKMLTMVKKHSRKTIFEIDDDVARITKDQGPSDQELKSNPGFLARMHALMRASHVVTVTTDVLAVVMRDVNPNVAVVPNGVDLNLWGDPAKRPSGDGTTSPIRCGYLLSANHVADGKVLITPWKKIAQRFPLVTFVLAGAFHWQLKEALGDRVEFVNGVSIQDYASFAKSLRLDIAVAPLTGTRFDQSKSNLKWLDGTALGVPMVMSNTGPYRASVRHGETGLLASDDRSWVKCIGSLVRDPALRQSIATAARAEVSNMWTNDHSADAWLAVLREVADRG